MFLPLPPKTSISTGAQLPCLLCMKTKLVSSMDDLAPLATGLGDGGTPKLGQELLHNVGLMVGLAETEIQVTNQPPEEPTKLSFRNLCKKNSSGYDYICLFTWNVCLFICLFICLLICLFFSFSPFIFLFFPFIPFFPFFICIPSFPFRVYMCYVVPVVPSV